MSLSTPKLDDAFRVLHQRAHEFVSDKQEELAAEFGFGTHDDYRIDWVNSTITFLKEDVPVITFTFQVVGRFQQTEERWTWRWYDEALSDPERSDLEIIKNYGDFYSFDFLTEAHIQASTDLAWALTAISAYLRGAQGVFRIQQEKEELFVYLLLPAIL